MSEYSSLPALDSQRWLAQFSVTFFSVDSSTRMGKTEHYGPLRVQRPFHPEGPECLHFYLLHPPGGLVGGDRLSIDLHLQQNSHVLMTTPSAGKIYRNISDHPQGQFVSLKVDDAAVLEYFPQENIVFDGASGELHTKINLKGTGLFCGWEITCLGRFESSEPFRLGHLQQSMMIYRDGRPLFCDRFQLQELPEKPSGLQAASAGFRGRSVFGTFVITADLLSDDEFSEQLIEWQIAMNAEGVQLAMTQKPGIWVVRALTDKAEKLRGAFEGLWQQVRPQVLGRQACAPRIWRT